MAEINLLRSYPKAKRNLEKRQQAKTSESIAIARQYGREYFDGPRDVGYGGYRYDGRWLPIARDIVAHYGLKPGNRVLDIGCAKGFLVKDMMIACPGLEVFGIDVSEYAVLNCEPEVVGRLHIGSCDQLPFPDASFDALLSINTLHNMDREGCLESLGEMKRVCKGNRMYVQVDSYRTPEERDLFLSWVLTARFHDYPEGWRALFAEAGYDGDYYWTIIE